MFNCIMIVSQFGFGFDCISSWLCLYFKHNDVSKPTIFIFIFSFLVLMVVGAPQIKSPPYCIFNCSDGFDQFQTCPVVNVFFPFFLVPLLSLEELSWPCQMHLIMTVPSMFALLYYGKIVVFANCILDLVANLFISYITRAVPKVRGHHG